MQHHIINTMLGESNYTLQHSSVSRIHYTLAEFYIVEKKSRIKFMVQIIVLKKTKYLYFYPLF